ncbi:hypothetical protein DFP72DRAFT_846864 [Ephemerocybe angulata]|uniref:Uncharacterized protein n=1 Tax=Ephemerocybe angulata TaxID=980116 RepID=A0A8H6M9I4_9AGAR|nr:hypothetical protein DFP72DRAFT_846864 [Tulosesus angulatus]
MSTRSPTRRRGRAGLPVQPGTLNRRLEAGLSRSIRFECDAGSSTTTQAPKWCTICQSLDHLYDACEYAKIPVWKEQVSLAAQPTTSAGGRGGARSGRGWSSPLILITTCTDVLDAVEVGVAPDAEALLKLEGDRDVWKHGFFPVADPCEAHAITPSGAGVKLGWYNIGLEGRVTVIRIKIEGVGSGGVMFVLALVLALAVRGRRSSSRRRAALERPISPSPGERSIILILDSNPSVPPSSHAADRLSSARCVINPRPVTVLRREMLCKPWNGRRTGTRLQAAEVDGDVESEGGGGRLTMMYLRVGLCNSEEDGGRSLSMVVYGDHDAEGECEEALRSASTLGLSSALKPAGAPVPSATMKSRPPPPLHALAPALAPTPGTYSDVVDVLFPNLSTARIQRKRSRRRCGLRDGCWGCVRMLVRRVILECGLAKEGMGSRVVLVGCLRCVLLSSVVEEDEETWNDEDDEGVGS